MRFNRRQVLAAMGASTLVGLPRPNFAAIELTFGVAKITTLSDGNLVLPMEFLLGNLPAADAAPVLAQYGITGDTVEPPCNLTLLQDRTNTVLFDAGSGSGFMPTAGKILDALGAIGLGADDITHVLFTHAHPDHLWGVLDLSLIHI